MKIIQSYLQGAKHKIKNQPCEDRTYTLSQNGVSVIALADGAGSKKYTHSADGAECVTKTICKFFCNNFDKFYNKENPEELQSVIMAVCQRALKERADEIGVDDIIKMSSTLLVVAVKDNLMIACHIGDGVIGKLTAKGTEVISAPDNGEFASTTYFITNPSADEHISLIKDRTDNAISYFLMSDGTQEYIYDEANGKFHDAARKMALLPFSGNGQEKLEETITKYMIDADPSSDDCSFICMFLNDEISGDYAQKSSSDEVPHDHTDKISLQNFIETFEKPNNDSDLAVEESTEKTTSVNSKTNKKHIVIIIIIVFIVALLTALLNAKNIKNMLSNNTASSTTSTMSNQENTTESTIEDTATETLSESTSNMNESNTGIHSDDEEEFLSTIDETVSGKGTESNVVPSDLENASYENSKQNN